VRQFSLAFGLVTSFFRIWSAYELSGFGVFLENDKWMDLRQIFSGFRRKPSCIKKHYTGALKTTVKQSMRCSFRYKMTQKGWIWA